LKEFYGCVRQKVSGGEQVGKEYSRSGYRSMRAGIQRYIISPPISRDWNIFADREFKQANLVYEGKLKSIKRSGKDTTRHKPPIEAKDMAKFYKTGVLSDTNPQSLLRKVFLEVSLHFGRRGREGWRSLKRDSFAICIDASNNEYVTLVHNELDKNHQNDENKVQCMFATNDDYCPVRSFKLYLKKMNPNCQAFLQRPLTKFAGRDTWYANAPLGVNSIGNLLKEISKEAGVSQIYTNHSIKASTATILKKSGFASQDVMAVTGHHNIQSLNSYASGPSMNDRAEMSKHLAAYGKNDDNMEVDIVKSKRDGCCGKISNRNEMYTLDNNVASIFAGATFTGNVNINVQICK
jgi:hypothetical protein